MGDSRCTCDFDLMSPGTTHNATCPAAKTQPDDDRVRAVVASEGRCRYRRIVQVTGWLDMGANARRVDRALQRLRKAGVLEYVYGYWQVKL